MSMTRGEMQDALWGDLQWGFTEVGITNTDDSGNLKEPLDRALLALGTSYSDLATGEAADGDEYTALAILHYTGLQTIYNAALAKVDVTIDAPNTSVKWSQFVANIAAALMEAKAEATPLMTTTVSSWVATSVNTGYLDTYGLEEA